MTLRRWVVVCEGASDCEHATTLADREIAFRVQWADGQLDDLREWTAIEPTESHKDERTGRRFTPWKRIKSLAMRHGIRYLGAKPAPGGSAYAEVWKAVKLAALSGPAASAILLVRDSDCDPDRREGLRHARALDAADLRVCVAIAHPEREAWSLNGFSPVTPVEAETLTSLRQEVGCHPVVDAHELNPKRETTPGGAEVRRSTKRVLRELTNDSREREAKCWTETTLERLREMGVHTGLRDFLDDVHTVLVADLDPSRARSPDR